MHIESESSFDVVVVGGGIAGCCAAIEAARAGASVCLASASGVFSGSSFYPGTWGLGLIGPRDASDIDDMVETILHVGRGAANAALVDSFVRGIPEAIAALEAMGVSLKRPANPDEPQYIPCFDHSLRMWRGLERASMERGFGRALCEGGVVRFDGCELLDITMDGGCARGALRRAFGEFGIHANHAGARGAAAQHRVQREGVSVRACLGRVGRADRARCS